ncbi:MAG: hypothetical protein IT356_06455 [Gemmatimonadaceae bacterium]|nr:hypothetical protein [Gemmatimonadaceae bacterium]
MFESLKATLHDLLHGQVSPADRHAVIADMRRALVAAKMGVADLREGAGVTRKRLAGERDQLATVRRRKALAEAIPDGETVAVAAKFEAQYEERIAVLERKLAAQEDEAALAERDYDEMLKQLKAANAGVGSGMTPESRGPTDAELGLPDDSDLRAELDSLARGRSRSDAEAAAAIRLEELKRKMGRQ